MGIPKNKKKILLKLKHQNRFQSLRKDLTHYLLKTFQKIQIQNTSNFETGRVFSQDETRK